MKLRIFLCSVFLFLGMGTIKLCAEENLDVWKYAYQGDYNLAHKEMLDNRTNTMEQIMTNQLIMAYLSFKNGDEDAMISFMYVLDRLIEHHLINPRDYKTNVSLSICKVTQ